MNSIVSQMSDTLETCAFKGHFPAAEVLSVPLHLGGERTWLFTGLSFLCSSVGKDHRAFVCLSLPPGSPQDCISQGQTRAHFPSEEKHSGLHTGADEHVLK